jgi:transposase InsO family protein
MLGIDVSRTTVAKYMVRHRRPPSPSWRSFIRGHLDEIVAVDFFTVPTLRNRVLYVFLVLSLDRRRILHFNVTENPTAAWTRQQIVEAFAWKTPSRFLQRDRDKIYGEVFRARVRGLGLEELMSAPRSPWQNGYVERLIGTIRRECLDHVVVLNERHLRRVLSRYLEYYHRWRPHSGLGMDAPDGRRVQGVHEGRIVEVPEVYGLHHHYERRAA